MKKFIAFTAFVFIYSNVSAQIQLINLLTENQKDPQCIDVTSPRFSWRMQSNTDQLIEQQAYQVIVDTFNNKLRKNVIIWSSGKVVSDQSTYIAYKGMPLSSGTQYFWQARIWDKNGLRSNWSQPATFRMGLLSEGDWRAEWISTTWANWVNGPAPLFRSAITLKKDIKSAYMYITSHGFYEAQINGTKVGDEYLTPGWTSYNKRLQYQCYEVTKQLTPGENAIGITLGSGWYRSPLGPYNPKPNFYGKELALLMQIKIVYADGSEQWVTSNESWKSSTGAIQYAEIYNGCIIDLRKGQTGWNETGFNDSQWLPVKVRPFSKNNLVATYNEPVKKHETFKPVKIITSPKGEKIIDFGQNLVGWVMINVKGRSGDSIKISHAEVLDKAGNFYIENLRSAKAQDIYILKDSISHIFEPQFTWHGFRYIKVEGIRGELNPADFTAVAIYSDMKPTGSFSCSNPSLNQLQHNIQWGQKGNFLDVPTDCPQRDERLGWTGDAQVFSHTAAFNMDVHNFFTKWLKDLSADQYPSGSVPYVVPDVFTNGNNEVGGSSGWGDASTIIPWNMYLAYGDKQVLENQYASMRAWIGFIQKHTKNDLWNSGEHFGDWLFYSVNDDRDGTSAITSKYLIAQCFYAFSTQILINTAEILHKKADVIYYKQLLKKIKTAFLNEYVTHNGLLVSDTQTAYVLALQFDILPPNLRQEAAQRLVDNIVRYHYHLTTGFLGTPYLCEVLSRFGHATVAYKLLLQDTYPSWLYPVKAGATTIWERWDGIKTDGSFEDASMNSYNHYAYGAIGDWMYQNITGIQAAKPGYKVIIIKPLMGGGLTWAAGSYICPYGRITCKWLITGRKFSMDVSIPQNTTAQIFIPDWKGENIKKVIVKSGTYHFDR